MYVLWGSESFGWIIWVVDNHPDNYVRKTVEIVEHYWIGVANGSLVVQVCMCIHVNFTLSYLSYHTLFAFRKALSFNTQNMTGNENGWRMRAWTKKKKKPAILTSQRKQRTLPPVFAHSEWITSLIAVVSPFQAYRFDKRRSDEKQQSAFLRSICARASYDAPLPCRTGRKSACRQKDRDRREDKSYTLRCCLNTNPRTILLHAQQRHTFRLRAVTIDIICSW